jgi:hypothetical protein
MSETETRKVFVVFGRNVKARDAVFAFLRAIDLAPMEGKPIGKKSGRAKWYDLRRFLTPYQLAFDSGKRTGK